MVIMGQTVWGGISDATLSRWVSMETLVRQRRWVSCGQKHSSMPVPVRSPYPAIKDFARSASGFCFLALSFGGPCLEGLIKNKI